MMDIESWFANRRLGSRGTDWKYVARLTPYGKSLKERTDLIRKEIVKQHRSALGNIRDQALPILGFEENTSLKKIIEMWSKKGPARLYDLKQCETWPEQFTTISSFNELQREYFNIVRSYYGFDLLVSEYKLKVARRLESILSKIGKSIAELNFPFEYPINLPNSDYILEALDPAYPSVGERAELSHFFKKLPLSKLNKDESSFDWKKKIAFSELDEKDQHIAIENATVFLKLSEIELEILLEESIPMTFMRRCLLKMADETFGRSEEIFLLNLAELTQISERRSFDFISIIERRFFQWQKEKKTEQESEHSQQKSVRGPQGRYFQGQKVGAGIVTGPAVWISDFEDVVGQKPGDVCFVERAFPAFIWLMPHLSAAVFNKLESFSELERLARAYSIPCVAGYRGGRESIPSGTQIRIESSLGRVIYP